MRHLMRQAAQLNPRRVWGNVSVVLLDDAGMVRINRLYLDREHATDVISFAAPLRPSAGLWQGEVFVNAQRAREIGARRADIDGELALYLAHGADHLAGSGDYTAADRQRMRRRELRWLRAARTLGLLDGLLRGCKTNLLV